MAEGIRFNSEPGDDDIESSTSEKDKKKKKKASKDVGATILGGAEVASTTKSESEIPKQNLFEQMRGWLFADSEKTPASAKSETANTESSEDSNDKMVINTAADVENIPVAESATEEAAIARAAELLARPRTSERPKDEPTVFESFRTILSRDELSSGEGLIDLSSTSEIPDNTELEPSLTPEQIDLKQSVENDLALIETVDSPEEEAAVHQAPKVLANVVVPAVVVPGNRYNSVNTPLTPLSTTSGGGRGGSNGGGSGGGPGGGPGGGNAGGAGGNSHNRNPGNSGGYNTVPPVASAAFANMLAQRLAFEAGHLAGRTRGIVEGLVPGVLVGAGIEHRRHRKFEKKMEKKAAEAHKKQQESINELERRTTRTEASQSDIVRQMTNERNRHDQAIQAAAIAEIEAHESVSSTTKVIVAEKTRLEAEKAKAEFIDRLNAQAAQQEQLAVQERLNSPEHHLETSAWHAMEVDKSGHIVQDSNLEYGHEYYREKAHETGPKDPLDVKAGGAAVAAVAAAASSQSSMSQPALSNSYSPIAPQPSPQPPAQNVPPLVPTTDTTDSQHYAISTATILVVFFIILILIIIISIFK